MYAYIKQLQTPAYTSNNTLDGRFWCAEENQQHCGRRTLATTATAGLWATTGIVLSALLLLLLLLLLVLLVVLDSVEDVRPSRLEEEEEEEEEAEAKAEAEADAVPDETPRSRSRSRSRSRL
jgi:hypothetical protein